MLTHNKKDTTKVFRNPSPNPVDIIQQLNEISEQLNLLAQSVSIYSKQMQYHLDQQEADAMLHMMEGADNV